MSSEFTLSRRHPECLDAEELQPGRLVQVINADDVSGSGVPYEVLLLVSEPYQGPYGGSFIVVLPQAPSENGEYTENYFERDEPGRSGTTGLSVRRLSMLGVEPGENGLYHKSRWVVRLPNRRTAASS